MHGSDGGLGNYKLFGVLIGAVHPVHISLSEGTLSYDVIQINGSGIKSCIASPQSRRKV